MEADACGLRPWVSTEGVCAEESTIQPEMGMSAPKVDCIGPIASPKCWRSSLEVLEGVGNWWKWVQGGWKVNWNMLGCDTFVFLCFTTSAVPNSLNCFYFSLPLLILSPVWHKEIPKNDFVGYFLIFSITALSILN